MPREARFGGPPRRPRRRFAAVRSSVSIAQIEPTLAGDTAWRLSEENLELDHVLLAVADLDAAAREIEARYGLTSVEGGRHPGGDGQPNRAARRDLSSS
jgi:hypothetical protein